MGNQLHPIGDIVHPMIPENFRVTNLKRETRDVFTISLIPENGETFEFKPGQFNMIYVFGVGEIPISISGDPENTSQVVHTIRVVGSVTRAISQLESGDILGIRGPFGSGFPVEFAEGDDVVIVAGGIGLAPLRPVMYKLLSNRDKYGKVILLYGARTPKDIIFHRELKKWRGRFDAEVEVTVDYADAGWHGNVGVVTTLISRVDFDPLNTTAFICGPEIMMRYTVLTLNNRGVPYENIYVSMERNMQCAIGFCGHCQYGPYFICKDGPVFRFDKIRPLFRIREL